MSTLDLTADVHKQRRATSINVRTFVDRFRARYDYLYQGLAVLATETSPGVWSITTFPGVATIVADSNFQYSEDHIYYGGSTYEIDEDSDLCYALESAGYDITCAGG